MPLIRPSMTTPALVLLLILLLFAGGALWWGFAHTRRRLREQAEVLARAYATEQHRAKQLMAINQVSQRVAAVLEPERLFADVVDLIQKTFGYYHVGIFTVEEGTGGVLFRASTSTAIQARGIDVAQGQGIIGWVAQHGEPILANDVTQEPRYRFEEALTETRAELAVPLVSVLAREGEAVGSDGTARRVVGVLDVQSNTVNAFTEDDLFVLQTIATQVAIALENARLYAARQEEAWSSTALLQVAEAVGSLCSLDDILESTVRITPMLVGVDRCTILLWDEDSQEFVAAKSYTNAQEVPPLFEGLRFQPGDLLLLDELRTRASPILVEQSADTAHVPTNLREGFGLGSLLALPLRAQGQIHGAMIVDRLDPTAVFSARQKSILGGIADQAAMAIANARLHDAQREEAWVSAALLQVAQALASSTDLRENIGKIARLTPLLAGVDRCMILLWQSDSGEFVPYEAHGLSRDALQLFSALHFKPGDVALLDEIVRTRSYVAVEDASQSTLIPQWLRSSFGIKSVLAVPLVSKGELLGTFMVDCTEGQSRFPARKIGIIEGIARQTALAIENARLYEAVMEQERMAQELRLAREIQVSFLPDRCPLLPGWELAADWLSAREVSGDFYDFVPVDDDHMGLVIADVSDKGVPAALFMSLTRTLVRASALEIRSPAKVLQRVNELIMTDTRSDMFVTMFYGVLNTRTGELTYASAGHNPPIWWQSASRQATSLVAKGIVLGVASDIDLEERHVMLEPGDIVVLYTDGVTEPVNREEEEFGEERLVQTIAMGNNRPCDELVRMIRDAVSAFVGDKPRSDDYTLVAVKRQPTY